MVRIPREPENHKLFYQAIAQHFNSEYLDTNGHDLPRFCFESYDPDIYINTDSKVWDVKVSKEVEDIGTAEAVLPITSENRIIENLTTWWEKKIRHDSRQ